MRELKIFDYAAILFSAAVIIILIISAYRGNNDKLYVHIENNNNQWIYPIDEDKKIEVNGPIEITVIVIKNNSVFVHDSPCPQKLCMHAKPLSREGEWTACMPNKVFIYIKGKKDEEKIDGISL